MEYETMGEKAALKTVGWGRDSGCVRMAPTPLVWFGIGGMACTSLGWSPIGTLEESREVALWAESAT